MKEVIHAIETISDKDVIKEFIGRQDTSGCTALLAVLPYVSDEAEGRWLRVYNEMFKYGDSR